jgi:3-hydroxyacyl-[acyl-carrier-protein] dehydratase
MDKNEIKTILPHREPMLLIDEVSLNEKGQAVGKYTVKGDEWFLQGHFPDNPIVPGVILCEMLAQSCCILFKDSIRGRIPLFASIQNAKFKSVVRPGDTIEIVCCIKKARDPFYFASGKGCVNGKLCVSGDFSFALMKGE